jgi:hypothetical protein
MPLSNGISLAMPLLVGVGTIFCTILIQGLVVVIIVNHVLRDLERGRVGARFSANLTLVASVTLLALGGHLIEMALWALVFLLCGEFPDFAAAFYHSGVNYTTLGYGDVVMSARWKLLGPLEASDGMLMFGVSTAVIFAVIQHLTQVRLGISDR